MSSSILHPSPKTKAVQYRFLNNGCIHWNTTKSPTQQKSGYLVSSTAFWTAFLLVMFFGNQEVYHAVLGNMIKTSFFCRKSHGDGIRPSSQFPASSSLRVPPFVELHAVVRKGLGMRGFAAACVKLLVGANPRMLCQFGHLKLGGFNHWSSTGGLMVDMNELFKWAMS